jgi:cell division protein FtsN
MEDSVLIETNNFSDDLECEYFVQIGAYGNKKYAYEAVKILDTIEFMTINDIYSSSDPGKLLHSVLSGPYENRSAANNAKEKITKKGFEPQLRTLCKKK